MSIGSLAKKSEMLPSFVDDFFTPWKTMFEGMDKKFSMPAVNVAETKDDYNLSLAAPGLKKDDFKIDMDGSLLTISAEKEEEKEEKEKNYSRREYNYSSFKRTFTIPEDVNVDKIDATYTDGVLKVLLPKKEEAKSHALKTIAVK